MTFCKNCGAVLGVGRFCTNCGAPVAPTTGVARSAEESAVEKTNIRLPAVQPDASTGARFPLFAEERVAAGDSFHTSLPAPATSPTTVVGSHRSGEANTRRKPFWVIPLALAVLCVLTIGIWLGNRGDDSANTAGTDGAATSSRGQVDEGADSAEPTPAPTAPPESTGPPVDLTERATATGPEPIAPGVDLAGNPVVYPVENVLDGDPTTAYRMSGDASGDSITVTLPGGTTVLEVGLINGYAKKDSSGGRTVDWYDRNRRILAVEWVFDDGTSVSQELSATKEMQVLAVNNIESDKVIMRIVEVSRKPTGELAKDVTAISEVVVRGRTD